MLLALTLTFMQAGTIWIVQLPQFWKRKRNLAAESQKAKSYLNILQQIQMGRCMWGIFEILLLEIPLPAFSGEQDMTLRYSTMSMTWAARLQ